MAEEQTENTAAAPAKKGKSKTLLIVGGIVLLVAAIGIPVGIMALKNKGNTEELAADAAGEDALVPEGADDEDEIEEGEEALGAIFPFENFVVNLNGGRYIRCQIQVEFNEREIPKRIYSRIVPIRDAIISLIAKRSADEVLSEKGRDALRGDVRDVINEMLRKELVKNVFFTQFLVQ